MAVRTSPHMVNGLIDLRTAVRNFPASGTSRSRPSAGCKSAMEVTLSMPRSLSEREIDGPNHDLQDADDEERRQELRFLPQPLEDHGRLQQDVEQIQRRAHRTSLDCGLRIGRQEPTLGRSIRNAKSTIRN